MLMGRKSPISALRAFLRISRSDNYSALFEIAQALILNFLRHHLKSDFLRCHQFLRISRTAKCSVLFEIVQIPDPKAIRALCFNRVAK